MILVDDRIGSVEVVPYLRPYGLNVEVTRLPIGDFQFVGNGPDGDVDVGIERKRLTDLVQCIRDKRLAGFQLIGDDDKPGLLETFDYLYLVVEGVYRPGLRGTTEYLRAGEWTTLCAGSSPILYLEVDSFLTSLALRGITRIGEPVRVDRTASIQETGAHIATLVSNWTGKLWKEHRSHRDIYTRVPRVVKGKVGFVKPRNDLTVKMIAQIDGLHEKAWECRKYFELPEDFVGASVRKWQQVDGIGKKMAERIVGQLRRVK
jgi:ERCC4-type nuclease